jgi:hypothetical protein
MKTLRQDERFDGNPRDTEERLCRIFRRDEFLCATGFSKREVQSVECRQAKGASFRVGLGYKRCGDRDGLGLGKVPLIQGDFRGPLILDDQVFCS